MLYQIQKWERRGHRGDEKVLTHALRDFAAPFAIKLKASWGLPQALRELIGVIYELPPMQITANKWSCALGLL
ncbi:hypothetical protein ACYZT2_01245 [Pseudomonas sp. MDT1-85]